MKSLRGSGKIIGSPVSIRQLAQDCNLPFPLSLSQFIDNPECPELGIAVTHFGQEGLMVFYRGQENILWHRTFNSLEWNVGLSGHGDGYTGIILTSSPTTFSRDNADLPSSFPQYNCFYRGEDNHLGLLTLSISGDSSFRWGRADWGGILTSAPAVASRYPGNVEVFYRGQNQHLWHQGVDGSVTIPEEDLGGILASAPAAVSLNPNRIDCFYRGQNLHLWHRWWDGRQWSSEEDLGGILASAPAVCVWGYRNPGQGSNIACLYRGPNKHIWWRWWNGRQWSSEQDVDALLFPPGSPTSLDFRGVLAYPGTPQFEPFTSDYWPTIANARIPLQLISWTALVPGQNEVDPRVQITDPQSPITTITFVSDITPLPPVTKFDLELRVQDANGEFLSVGHEIDIVRQ